MTAEITIDALGPLGDGVHNGPNGPVYVERTLPGDRLRVSVARGSGGVLRGTPQAVLAESPSRQVPPCPHYDACGGCTLQHATDAFYRDWKLNIVRAALHKAGVEPDEWDPPVFVPPGTRRRVTFAAFRSGRGVTLGYFRRRSQMVTAIDACLVVAPPILSTRAAMIPGLGSLLQAGKTADVFLQTVGGLTEAVITGPVGPRGHLDLSVQEAAASLAQSAALARLAWRPQDRTEPETLIERAPLRARFGALEVALPPLAFLQPTDSGEAALVAGVLALLPERGRFADLFCGCGTFTGPLLARGPVEAFDNAGPAVRALRKAAGQKPLTVTERDLSRSPVNAAALARTDAVVFDPPRAGAEAQAAELAASTVPHVVAVSCNPTSFARDARILLGGGYKLRRLRVVDQFTWSHHVELIAGFTKAR